jgi:cellulose 1,4-beta-cellobiosidase
MTAGITITAWINAVDWAGNRRILQKGNTDNQYRFLCENNVLKFHLNGVNTLTGALPPTNAWVHVAATWDGSTMVIYTNGIQEAAMAATGTIATTSDPLVIAKKNGSTVAGDFFNGEIDEVRIYNRALGISEINTVMHAGDSLPTAPGGLTAAAGNGQVNLSWTAVSSASSYNIKRSTMNGGSYATIGSSFGASYADAGLTNGTTYYYVVSSVNSTNESANSAQASARPGVGVVFYIDVNYSGGASQILGAGNYTLSQLQAAGMPNDAASSCRIPNGWTVIVYRDDNFAGPTWTLTNDTPNFTVFSGLNDNLSSCKIMAGAIPSTPGGLTATAGNATGRLVWNTSSGAALYNLKRSTNNGGPYTPLAETTTTAFTDQPLANGTTYYYVVSALNVTGESANSTQVSLTPFIPPPLVLTVLPQTNGQFSFQFPGVDGTNYVVESSPDFKSWTPVRTNTTSGGIYIFTDTNATAPALFYRVFQP